MAGAILISGWLRRNADHIPKVLMLMGFLPFAIGNFHLYMAAISWPGWLGYVKGAELSVLDALALSLYPALPASPHRLPFRWPMAIYFLVALASVFEASQPTAALFYIWQVLRMFMVYAVVAKACAFDEGAPFALLKGMASGVAMEAGIAIWERYGLGILQATGTLGHQNLLGLMSHFVVFPCFALLLAGRGGIFPAAATLTGIVVEVLTTSRATVAIAATGYAVLFILSSMRRWTPRKAAVLLTGGALLAVVTPVVLSSFEHRFARDEQTTYDERAAFSSVAQMMLMDHPMGVGANHYVISANIEGYNERADVLPVEASRSANVHNVYWLVADETGYLGILAFVILLICPLLTSFRQGWRFRKDQRGDILLGLGVALLMVYVHSFFEWIFVTFQAQYMFVMDVGLVAGLTQPLQHLVPGELSISRAYPFARRRGNPDKRLRPPLSES